MEPELPTDSPLPQPREGWRRQSPTVSLPEVHGSIPMPVAVCIAALNVWLLYQTVIG